MMNKVSVFLGAALIGISMHAGDFGAIYAHEHKRIRISDDIDLNALESLSISEAPCGPLNQAHQKLINNTIMTPAYVGELLLSKVNEQEKREIMNELDVIIRMGNGGGPGVHYYAGQDDKEQRAQRDTVEAFKVIEKIFKDYGIAIDHLERWDWFYPLNRALSPNPTINIARLDKAELLMELFNAAHYTYAWPAIHPMKTMTLEEAQTIVKDDLRFEYHEEKPLKINISGDVMNAHFYNRENGRGAAHYAVRNVLKSMAERHLAHIAKQETVVKEHWKNLDDLCKKSAREKITTKVDDLKIIPIGFWCFKDKKNKELIIDDKALRESGIVPELQYIPQGANGTIRIEDVDETKKRIEEALYQAWEAECFESQ